MVTYNKIEKGIINVVLKSPFISAILLNLKIKHDETLSGGTMATDTVHVYYSESFVNTLTTEEIAAVLCHEVMHVALLHHFRRGDRDPKLWNRACDYVVNRSIKDLYRIPDGCLYERAFDAFSEEEIYEKLKSSKNNSGKSDILGDDIVNAADGDTCGNREQEVKGLVAGAIATENQAGNTPGSISLALPRMFDLMQEKINWKEVLSRFVNQSAKDDYNWKLPNPRYSYSGMYLPIQYSEQLSDIVIMIDTSGSINMKMFNEFMSELNAVLSTFNTSAIKLMWIDHNLNGIEELDFAKGIEDLKPKGGGGTSFAPGFEYLDKNDIIPPCVIYFTDGECNSFADKSIVHYPVLWVQTKSYYKFTPPYGEVIKLEEAPK